MGIDNVAVLTVNQLQSFSVNVFEGFLIENCRVKLVNKNIRQRSEFSRNFDNLLRGYCSKETYWAQEIGVFKSKSESPFFIGEFHPCVYLVFFY